ncbi:MAG: flagellar filament capping protein FliD [Methylococcales bacterium]|nr:flagellar filament capping protein FliD [Methylococcales bacterium]
MEIDFLNSLQVGSKMDTKKLVSDLVSAEIYPKQSSIDKVKKETETQISGLGTLKSSMQTLLSNFQNLDDNREFNFSIISSNNSNVVSVETGSGVATTGNHSIAVSALAQSEILATNTFSSSSADQNNGSATDFVFTVNGTQHTVSLSAGAASLDKLAEGINEIKSTTGVTAQVISTGTDQYRLLLEGTSGSTNDITIDTDLSSTYASTAVTLTADSGIANGETVAIALDANTTITVTGSSTSNASDLAALFTAKSATTTGWDITNEAGVVTFTKNSDYVTANSVDAQTAVAMANSAITLGNPPGGGASTVTMSASHSEAGNLGFDLNLSSNQLRVAQDASFTVNGLAVTRNTNKVTDIISGVTLNLNATSDTATNININRDLDLAKTTIKSTVDAVNLFSSTLKTLSNSVDGDLANDSTVIQIKNKIKQLFYSESSKPGTTIKTMTDLGISYDKFGTLLVDDSKLDSAMVDHFDEIKDFFSGGTDDHSSYDSEDKPLLSALTLSSGLNNSNDTATITIASGVTISVTGAYASAADLATAFATQTATGYTLTAAGDELIIKSTATGASVSALSPSISSTGTSVSFSSTENNAGSDGLTRGLAGDITILLGDYLAYNGTLDFMQSQFDGFIEQTELDQSELDERKTSIEDRYTKQFTAMNKIMAEMNALKEYLDQQLENLPNNNKD